ncbi:MAG: response regulator [Bacteroidales bacterium]|nr:response regulator [Bacteroidales bacterium]
MRKILAIDDKKDNLTTIEAIVKNRMPECKVLTALSGEEGIKKAREEQPDTILLDIIMPQLDGYEACKRLKEDELTKQIPVIMITAIKTDSKSRIYGLACGADAFLSKPIDPTELSAQIKVTLRIKEAEDKLRAEKEVLEEKVFERTKLIMDSEKRFKYLVKNSNDLIVIIDKTGKEVFVSDSVERITGFTPAEVLNHSGFEFLHPDDVEHMSETLSKLLATPKKTMKDEYRHKTKSGGWVYLEAIGTNYLQEPLINGIVLNIRDITEQKIAEKALKESENRFKFLSEAPVEAIFISEKGICIDQNLSAQNMFGYSLKEAIGRPGTDWITPQSREIVLKNMMSGYEKPYEVTALRKNGETFPAEIQGRMVEIDGRMIRITALNDITQRKKSDQAQKILYNISNAANTNESVEELCKLIQKQLGTIIDTTNFYVALYDNENDTISLQYMADQLDELSTFPAGKTLTAYVIKSEKSLLATKKIMDDLEKVGKTESFGSDSKIWLGVPLKIREKVTGAIVVQSYDNENAYDENDKNILEFVSRQISIIIERKKSEETIKLALGKAKESDRLKSAFLSTMSHELRTPLNAIIGFSEIIDRDTHIDEIIDYVETINSSGSHLLSLVEDIFDISLIESGEVKIENENVNIFNFMNNIRKTILNEQMKINKHNIDIQHKMIENDHEIMVNTDSRKLSQILLNLLKNALKFTHEGQIEYGYIKEKENNKSILKFFVKDTGIGISKEKQDLIFDIFRQGDDTHTRRYEGVGIGLSVAKRLTELLGGKIWLESQHVKGSEFYFTIPLTNNSIKDNEPKSVETKKIDDISGKTLLIVEDIESNYLYFEALLKNLNFKILWAKTGKEAIRFCSDYPDIDLVFMDIKMPDLSGYEATKQIKKFRPKLPIIAQTAYALSGDDKKAENAGCDDYITKPFKKQTIFNIIEKYLN